MSRRVLGAIAVLWIAQAAGCKQCATCSDFPASCSGPGCVGSSNYQLRTGFTAPSDAVTKTGGSNAAEGSTTGSKNATAGSSTDANAAGTAATSNTSDGVKNDASPTPPPEDLKSPLSPIDPPK